MILHQLSDASVSAAIEDGYLIVHTRVQDDAHHRANRTQREQRRPYAPLPFHPAGAKTVWGFSAHPLLWKLHQRRHPDLHLALHSGDRFAREKASATIARQHPEWVTAKPNTFYLP